MFDFVLDSPQSASVMTPMEQRAATRNVMAIQLALYAQMAQPQPDAALSPEQVEAMFLFAAQITEMVEA
jgi:hypothetical protein|tara:strand:+ start:210 stop:416 length:207 start_codon:yes stop_codon:yes gene_type:complete